MPIPKEKEEIGEQLFAKVAEIESELCAQVTGKICFDISRSTL